MTAKPFFRIEMLPAFHGDCLFVEYGRGQTVHRVLIDGGPIATYPALEARIEALPEDDRAFELLVMTHVDTDHVEGIVRLVANKPLPIALRDLWFNGWRHLEPDDGNLGGKQGEFLSALIVHRRLESKWNKAFGGKAVVVPDEGPLPTHTLPGGMVLTLLSPSHEKLTKMAKAWKKDLGDAITPGDLDEAWDLLAKKKMYLPEEGLLGAKKDLDEILARQTKVDDSAANGSAIAFLAEYEGKSALFLADAHADVVTASLDRLLEARGLETLSVDAVKVAHHGSAGNVSDELLARIESPRFLFSTNGDKFHHPDREAVLRIIDRATPPKPTLFFNYDVATTAPWKSPDDTVKGRFRAEYNPDNDAPFVIEL